MTLTKIETAEEFPLKNYHFIKDGKDLLGHGRVEDRPASFSAHEWERKLDSAADALHDRYGDLYEDESGNLYGVETIYVDGEFVPAVWARVERAD